MSKAEIDYHSLLPVNANIMELSYEPHLSLRVRIGELPPALTPGESVPIADVIFAGVREFEISLELDSRNPRIAKISNWPERSKGELVSSSAPTTGISLETSVGSITVVCDSVRRTDLVAVPIVGEAKS